MLTYGRRQRIAAYFSLAVFLKQLLLAPMLFKPKPIFQQPELEVRFTIGVLGLPWLYLMAAYFDSERLALLQLEPMPNIKTESKLGD